MISLFDAHCHLNEQGLFSDWKQHVQAFIDLWGKGLVMAGANKEYNEKGIHIAEESLNFFPDFFLKTCIGLHPGDIHQLKKSLKDEITQLKLRYQKHPSLIIAIGECWIDHHYPEYQQYHNAQKELFALQCDLAQELQLPIVIHSRDAFTETLDILKHYPELTIYFHCRGYGPEEIKQLQSLFPKLFIGYAGNISYPKADEIRASLLQTATHQLLLETDAPYLAPQKFRGSINTPQNIKENWRFIAELIGITEDELRKIGRNNFFKLYDKSR